jgi:hypothetical protein
MLRGIKGRLPSPAIVIAILALVAGVTGVAVAQPAAKKPVTKKSVKKIAKKQINKLAPGLNVGSADVANNVMAATVPVGDSCDITKQTGGITATKSGLPANTKCDVTFPQSVTDCSVGATPLHPTGDLPGQATIRYLNGATVKVGRYDGTGTTPTAGLFSIFAVCPGPDGL